MPFKSDEWNKEYNKPIYKFLIEILNDCWKQEQNNRPTFEDILDKLIENEKNFSFDEIKNKTKDFENKIELSDIN